MTGRISALAAGLAAAFAALVAALAAVPAAAQDKLTVGAIYVGSVNDYGYNRAMKDGLEEMKRNIPGLTLIEAENVPETAESQRIMEGMIQQGAKLVLSARDVIEDLWPELLPRLAARRAAAAEAALSAPERQILAAIGPEGRHVDDVIRQAAVPPGAALETLLALELRGLVSQLPGKRFCRRAA